MKTFICLFGLALAASSSHAQGATWEPVAPVMGQSLALHYDAVAGALPDATATVRLHWGLYDPETGGWSLPPSINWPAGSSSPDGFALQSPMTPAGGGVFDLVLPSTEPMEHIAFVFTDGANNWDNNGGANWIIDYLGDDVPCWWAPLEPETGDLFTVYYNTGPGTLPGGPVLLHWGINESGAGNWQEPPQAIWPAGTVPAGDNMAVRSPMVDEGEGIWSIQILAAAGVNSFHWVFTNGSVWDGNGGSNWNVYVGEPPVFVDVWTRFRLDPRSSFYSGPRPVTSVNLAGTMNGWNSTATPLVLQPDGTWIVDRVLQEGDYQYKFVVNGNNWTPDPDNPRANANDNGNSMLTLVPATAPVATGWSSPDGLVTRLPLTLDLALGVRQPDTGEALDPQAFVTRLDGQTVAHQWDGDSLRINLSLVAEGERRVEFILTDMDGGQTTARWCGALHAEGWLALDPTRDDDGPGTYTYPTPFDGYTDIESVELREAALGDTLQLHVRLRLLHDYTRVHVLLLPTLDASISGDHLRDELDTPDWSQGGVALSLLKPTSPYLNPEQDNRILLDHTPLTAGEQVIVRQDGQSLIVSLPMDLLEERLGSWQEAWNLACWSTITGVAPVDGGVTEVGPAQGGVTAAWDCDVYDAALIQPMVLENAMLGNSSLGRTARIDAVRRGFAAVLPEDVGPHMSAPGPVVRILTQGGATVVAQRTVRGTSSPDTMGLVWLVREHAGGVDSTSATLTNGEWSVTVTLLDGLNSFQARAQDGDAMWGNSSIMETTLIRDHAPQPQISMLLQESAINLYATATVDIDGDIVSWLWEMDGNNPAPVEIANATQTIANIPVLPTVDGQYWLTLTVTDAAGHVGTARGLFEVERGQTRPVGQGDYPLWVRDAIVYEIYVRSFDSGRTLAAITDRLDEIVELGANTLWFMPIFEGPSDHGYAVNNYMAIEQDYGSLDDFRNLVEEAHALGLRVVLDMVLNHSSIDHPWMQQALQYVEDTPFRAYYMWNFDGTHQYYYDWTSLPNFNVSSPDLKREAALLSRYWVEELGVDGYRCDVAWGPMERNAQFWRDWRRAIRVTRPDLLLLAEAGATDFSIYDGRFNLAYDWELFWQGFGNLQTVSPGTLQDRVSNVGFWFPDNGLPFRFLENHDEARFISNHTVPQTKLAAALLFSLPGVPLIYAGQEVGETSPRGLINWSDPHQLRPFYKLLCETRTAWPQFRTNRVLQLVNNEPSQVYSFARVPANPAADGVAICVYNLSELARTIQLQLPVEDWGMNDGTWYLTDLFTGESLMWVAGVPFPISLNLAPWEPRWYLLADEPAQVDLPDEPTALPGEFTLGAPWPNPFNPVVSIPLNVPLASHVAVDIYNLAGQHVTRLLDGTVPAGSHLVRWDGTAQASGLYLVRAVSGGDAITRKVMLVK